MKQRRLRQLNKLVNRKTTRVFQKRDKFRVIDIINNKVVIDWNDFKTVINYIETGTFEKVV